MMISKKERGVTGRAFFTVLFLVPLLISAQAQRKTIFLPLKEAVETVTTNNSAVQSAGIDKAIAYEKYKQTNAGFLPRVNFSYAGLVTDNPLNVFGSKLQQKTVAATDFDPSLLNHPGGVSDFTTKIEVLQPLVNMDAVYIKKSALVQVEGVQLKAQRTKEYLIFETQKAYHQLQVAHLAVAVLEEALATAKSIHDFTNNRVRQGLIQKSDLLNVEVQVLEIETNLNEAKANVLNASDYLSVLMDRPLGVLYTTEEMKQEASMEGTEADLPRNRADFLAIEKAMEATGLLLKSSRMQYLPRLNGFGSYQLNDKRLAGFNAGSYLAGIQLTWNIFDGNNTKRQIAGWKLEQDKLGIQLHSLQQENQQLLDKGYRDLANALFKINQQNLAIAQADEALRILRNRYEEGLVNTNDVLAAQTQLSRQKLMRAEAILNFNISQAYIRFLTTADISK